jgi:beta-galactosidase
MSSENWSPRTDYDGRGSYGHLKSVFGYYEVLTELGLPVHLKHMHDFDWNSDISGQLAIIPHATVITTEQMEGMKKFISNGNTILMSGLSGLINEKTEAWVFQGFPFQEFLGANLKEYRWIDDIFKVDIQEPVVSLPAHLWEGDIENFNAKVIGAHDGKITAIENTYKKGKAIWIPSLIGLGAWKDDNKPLAELLSNITTTQTESMPFRFSGYQEGCLLRILENNDQYVTIVTNGTQKPNNCYLDINTDLKPEVIWGKANSLSDKEINLDPLETTVILWK